MVKTTNGFDLIENQTGEAAQAFGRMVAFHGQMGMYAVSYTHLDVYKRQHIPHISPTLRKEHFKACLNSKPKWQGFWAVKLLMRQCMMAQRPVPKQLLWRNV